MSTIDPTIVKGLIEAQLQTCDAAVVSVYFAGMGVPDNVDRWAELVAIDLADSDSCDDEDPTQAGGLDEMDITVTVNCFASQSAMRVKGGSLAGVMAEVRKRLHRRRLADATTTHEVDLNSTTVTADPMDGGGQRRTATGVVIARGKVTRVSGAGMAALV